MENENKFIESAKNANIIVNTMESGEKLLKKGIKHVNSDDYPELLHTHQDGRYYMQCIPCSENIPDYKTIFTDVKFHQ